MLKACLSPPLSNFQCQRNQTSQVHAPPHYNVSTGYYSKLNCLGMLFKKNADYMQCVPDEAILSIVLKSILQYMFFQFIMSYCQRTIDTDFAPTRSQVQHLNECKCMHTLTIASVERIVISFCNTFIQLKFGYCLLWILLQYFVKIPVKFKVPYQAAFLGI